MMPHSNSSRELILKRGEPFSLGQLILATAMPTRIVYKVQVDGSVGDLYQYDGVWPGPASFGSGHSIENYVHFTRMESLGPGQYHPGEEFKLRMTSAELTTLYKFFGS